MYFLPLCPLPPELLGLLGKGEHPAGKRRSVSPWDASLARQDPKRCPVHGKDPSAAGGFHRNQG